MKAKVFSVALANGGATNLEKSLNAWLCEQDDAIRIHNVGQSQENGSVILTVFYSSTGKPHQETEDLRALFREPAVV